MWIWEGCEGEAILILVNLKTVALNITASRIFA